MRGIGVLLGLSAGCGIVEPKKLKAFSGLIKDQSLARLWRAL